jgi:hypothetical protein
MFFEHTERQIGQGYDPMFPTFPAYLRIVGSSDPVFPDESVYDKRILIKEDLSRAQSPPFPRTETRSQAAHIKKVQVRVFANIGIEISPQFFDGKDVRFPGAFPA